MHSQRDSWLVARRITAPAAVMSLTLASAAAPPQLRLVALSGQPAPGAAAGTRFASFGSGQFDGAPSIGADSAAGFAAILSDGTAGFWADHGSGPKLLAHSGDHAPGTDPGVVFSQRLSEIILVTPPLLVPGHAVFRDTLSGPGVGLSNDEGFWTAGASGLSLLVREGAPAPGLAGIQLSSMMLFGIDNSGRAIVSSILTGAVVQDNNESIWRAAPGTGLELIAREGSAAPGAGFGVVFAAPVGPSAFPIILGNAVGDILFQGNLQGPGTGLGNDEALFIKSDSGTRLFIREGDPVPGMPGFAFREGSTAGFRSSDISFNDSGHVAIAARASGSTGLVTAVLTDISGGLAPIVRSGDPAPGTNGQFAFVVGPVMNIRGDVAFLGSTESGSVPPVGLWVHSNGGLRAVAIPGQALPGQPASTVIQSIQSIRGFGDDGLVLFVAVLTVPGGLSSTALLVADPAGQISVVARTGATLDVGGDVRTVTEVAVRPDALSDDSHAAFAVVFSDGSGAEFLAAVGSSCYANCDGSASAPVLNVNDFTCFLNRFGAGEPYANCDGSTAAPVLNVNDFVCFLGKFAAGCP